MRGAITYIIKIVTAFTVAHSITLSLAACHVVSLPSRLTESAIAASVILAAANNLSGPWCVNVAGWWHSDSDWCMASASRTRYPRLGLNAGALALRLVGFNLGVEAGQLAIVAIFVPSPSPCAGPAFYQIFLLKAGSVAVMLIAFVWFLERVLNFKVLLF